MIADIVPLCKTLNNTYYILWILWLFILEVWNHSDDFDVKHYKKLTQEGKDMILEVKIKPFAVSFKFLDKRLAIQTDLKVKSFNLISHLATSWISYSLWVLMGASCIMSLNIFTKWENHFPQSEVNWVCRCPYCVLCSYC